MSTHKFSIGEKVAYNTPFRAAAPTGEYEVIRLLPLEAGEYHYRIKSALESHERVVREDQLSSSKARVGAG
jgi:hypothetical protein